MPFISADPNHAEALFNLACCFSKKGETVGAEENLRRAIAADFASTHKHPPIVA